MSEGRLERRDVHGPPGFQRCARYRHRAQHVIGSRSVALVRSTGGVHGRAEVERLGDRGYDRGRVQGEVLHQKPHRTRRCATPKRSSKEEKRRLQCTPRTCSAPAGVNKRSRGEDGGIPLRRSRDCCRYIRR
eukprot:5089055-Pleurochrysis_carterae.AAC.1